jgi:hypothetical protein
VANVKERTNKSNRLSCARARTHTHTHTCVCARAHTHSQREGEREREHAHTNTFHVTIVQPDPVVYSFPMFSQRKCSSLFSSDNKPAFAPYKPVAAFPVSSPFSLPPDSIRFSCSRRRPSYPLFPSTADRPQ